MLYIILGILIILILGIIIVYMMLHNIEEYACNLMIYLFPAKCPISICDISQYEEDKTIWLQLGVTKEDKCYNQVLQRKGILVDYGVTRVYRKNNIIKVIL